MTSINLLNLAKIGQLDPVALSMVLLKRMLTSAKQRLRDAEFAENSPETRFDCAYTAIRTVADIGLHLNGFRTSSSKPGHHQTDCCSMPGIHAGRGRSHGAHTRRLAQAAQPVRL
jgi:hypothetical protein